MVYEYGEIIVDIVYGGAFYVFIPAVRLGISLGKTSVDTLRAAAKKIKGVKTFPTHNAVSRLYMHGYNW